MWQVKYYFNKIKRKYQNGFTGWDWFNVVLTLLNAYFFYIALITLNPLGLALNGIFLYIGIKNLIQ